MKSQKTLFAILITIITASLALTITTTALLTVSQTVPMTGTINAVNVSIFSDSALTQPCTALTAGNINPGASATQTIYIKNTGNMPETLTLTTSNWSPANANSVLTLTWNRQNYVLAAGASVQATLTLTAAANTGSLTTFSLDVTITGTS